MTKPDHTTQGRRLIALLKRRAMTCMDLNMTGVSSCWWKRVAETLKPGEKLVKLKIDDRPTVYRVVKG